jgi:hypothetical protein
VEEGEEEEDEVEDKNEEKKVHSLYICFANSRVGAKMIAKGEICGLFLLLLVICK